jgi:pimeloyl-ACP methyl ester carboxylesterase
MPLGYAQFGQGPHRVIALHGWFGDQTSFDPMRDALSGDEFSYVFPACRGYGASKHLAGDYSMAEISRDVLVLADSLGWQRFSLVGHSMGGKAVQRILADAPSRVQRIVAVTPVPASGAPMPDEVDALFSGAARNLENRRTIIDFSTGNRLSKTWINHLARYSADMSTVEAFAGYFQAWSKGDFSAEIAGNPVPIKAIVGEHDSSLTAEVMNATYATWYPNAEVEVMPNACHYPMNETPVALSSAMEAFLRR